MLMTIAFVFMQGTLFANANPTTASRDGDIITASLQVKPDKPKVPYKKRKGKVSGSELACFADALEHEPTQNLVGRVTAGHAILVRATQHGSICAAIHAPGQFEYTTKRKPSAETLRIAKEMYDDWKTGRATFEVELQRKVWGCWYFHDKRVTPSWAVKFKKGGGFCGKFAGLYMYRDPSKPLQHAYKNNG
jgi:hypothetical protein